MSLGFRLLGDSIGPKAMNLVLQAVQVGRDVRRSIRDESGVIDLGRDSVEEGLGERRGPSQRGSTESWR